MKLSNNVLRQHMLFLKPYKKERNVLFKDLFNTLCKTDIQLYGMGHTVKNHRDNEIGNLLPPLYGLFFYDLQQMIF